MSAKTNGGVESDAGCGGLGTAELLSALATPFPESLVSWVVTATRQSNRGKQGLVVAYADPRAYTDRLNRLVTAAGWTREYAVQVAHGFERKKKGMDAAFAAAKVLIVCKLTIFNLGTHSGTGEAWADDENALTSAEAQALKRACACFGLGRYFYDVPRSWVELDGYDRPISLPSLPEWAVPAGSNPNDRSKNGNGSNNNRGETAGTHERAEQSGASSGGNGRAVSYEAHGEFAEVRNTLLSLAREQAGARHITIGEVVAWASDGTFRYADMSKMTAADTEKLTSAIRRLKEASV